MSCDQHFIQFIFIFISRKKGKNTTTATKTNEENTNINAKFVLTPPFNTIAALGKETNTDKKIKNKKNKKKVLYVYFYAVRKYL